MTIEEELELALRAEALRIDPPVIDLVEDGVARGRAMRRRRRARLVFVGAALVLVAGAGVVVAGQHLGDGEAPVAASDGGDRSSGDGVRVGSSSQDDDPAQLDPDAVLDTVLALLPPGEITDVNTGSEGVASVWLDFVYDDGLGASWMSGSVVLTPRGAVPQCAAGAVGTCEDQVLDDGTVVLLETGPYYQDGREPGRLLWQATAASPSGLTVRLSEMNAPTEKRSEPNREQPPLSLEQLAAVVTDAVWGELTAGLAAAAEAERTAQELADEAAAAAAAAAEAHVGADLAADLGPGWVGGGTEMPLSAVPSPEVRAGLPDGYRGAVVNRDVYTAGTMSLEDLCAPGIEKGLESLPCEAAGEGLWVHRVRSVADDLAPSDPVQDDVSVVYVGDDGRLSHVRVWVSEPAETSTPERRAAALDWLEEQVDDLARAATAALAGDQG